MRWRASRSVRIQSPAAKPRQGEFCAVDRYRFFFFFFALLVLFKLDVVRLVVRWNFKYGLKGVKVIIYFLFCSSSNFFSSLSFACVRIIKIKNC